MKLKKCCKESSKIMMDNPETDKGGNLTPCLWYVPRGGFEEEGWLVKIKFCPYCGKKLEVMNDEQKKQI